MSGIGSEKADDVDRTLKLNYRFEMQFLREVHLVDVGGPAFQERRRKSTPRFGYYAFFGRRKADRYSAPLFALLVAVVALNVLDSLLTMMILDQKGWEANPIVQAAMDIHGENFWWIWKFGLVSFCLILLCLHSRYKLAKRAMVFLTTVYLCLVLYQIYLLKMM
jgi:hypothetical protein